MSKKKLLEAHLEEQLEFKKHAEKHNPRLVGEINERLAGVLERIRAEDNEEPANT